MPLLFLQRGRRCIAFDVRCRVNPLSLVVEWGRDSSLEHPCGCARSLPFPIPSRIAASPSHMPCCAMRELRPTLVMLDGGDSGTHGAAWSWAGLGNSESSVLLEDIIFEHEPDFYSISSSGLRIRYTDVDQVNTLWYRKALAAARALRARRISSFFCLNASRDTCLYRFVCIFCVVTKCILYNKNK